MGSVHRAGRLLRRHWWTAAAVLVAFAVAMFGDLGLIGAATLGAYSVVNSAGVHYYCRHLRSRRPGRQRAMQLLAVGLVPVGVVGVMSTPSGLVPSEMVTSGSPNDQQRRNTAGIQMGSTLGPGGRTGT